LELVETRPELVISQATQGATSSADITSLVSTLNYRDSKTAGNINVVRCEDEKVDYFDRNHPRCSSRTIVAKINSTLSLVSCCCGRICLERESFSTVTTAPGPSNQDRCTVSVALGERSYEIEIGTGCLDTWGAALGSWMAGRFGSASVPGKALIVTDRHVARPHAELVAGSLTNAGWQTARVELEPGEQTKSLATAERIFDALVELKADRRTVVVAVGGGVVGDTAGFSAATYARGIPFVPVPTTLLAQVDSSVGGKVGVNHPKGKNLIGAFHQPLGVFIDTGTLTTLPDRDYRSGLAEVVKYGVILDAEFFDQLEAHREELNQRSSDVLREVISRSCRLKADVVERDEYETTGLRAVLNYGHTFAHAYEALAGYSGLTHGEAVAIGMVHASRLAERLGRIDEQITARQVRLLDGLGLPTRLPAACRFDVASVLDRMRLDKKSQGGLPRFVLPTRMGHVELTDGVREPDVRAVLVQALAECA
jgi:3-dehydroquinate synthase